MSLQDKVTRTVEVIEAAEAAAYEKRSTLRDWMRRRPLAWMVRNPFSTLLIGVADAIALLVLAIR